MIYILVIAASAGGFAPLRRIIASLPDPCLAAVFVAMHIGPNASILPELLSAKHRAAFPKNGDTIEAGHIYVAPADHHMVLEETSIRVIQGPKVHHTRPAADPLFISAAEIHGRRVMGVVLSGGGGDGAVGLRTIKEFGGTAFVQDPKEALIPSMPYSAIAADHPDGCLPVEELIGRVEAFCSSSEAP